MRVKTVAAVLAISSMFGLSGCGDSRPDNSKIQTAPDERIAPPTAVSPGGKDAQGGASRKRG